MPLSLTLVVSAAYVAQAYNENCDASDVTYHCPDYDAACIGSRCCKPTGIACHQNGHACCSGYCVNEICQYLGNTSDADDSNAMDKHAQPPHQVVETQLGLDSTVQWNEYCDDYSNPPQHCTDVGAACQGNRCCKPDGIQCGDGRACCSRNCLNGKCVSFSEGNSTASAMLAITKVAQDDDTFKATSQYYCAGCGGFNSPENCMNSCGAYCIDHYNSHDAVCFNTQCDKLQCRLSGGSLETHGESVEDPQATIPTTTKVAQDDDTFNTTSQYYCAGCGGFNSPENCMNSCGAYCIDHYNSHDAVCFNTQCDKLQCRLNGESLETNGKSVEGPLATIPARAAQDDDTFNVTSQYYCAGCGGFNSPENCMNSCGAYCIDHYNSHDAVCFNTQCDKLQCRLNGNGGLQSVIVV